MNDRNKGKKAFNSEAHAFVKESDSPKFQKDDNNKLTISINTVPVIHARSAARDVIHKSLNSNFCGQKVIIIFYF